MENPEPKKIIRNLLFKDEVFNIIGAAFEVHKELGNGFLEAVYQEALGIEFSTRQIPYKPQFEIPIKYKNNSLNKSYRPDFIAYEKIIIELKSSEMLTKVDEAQLFNYLKASGFSLGLLINFGNTKLEWIRRVLQVNKDPA